MKITITKIIKIIIYNKNNTQNSSYNDIEKNAQNTPYSNDNILPMGKMMTVLDVKGVSVSDITTDVISFIKQSTEIMDNYYPGTARHFYF